MQTPRHPSSLQPVLLFDGVCNLCNGSVRWVIRWDRRSEFRFAALQSKAGRELLAALQCDADKLPDSVLLVDESGLHMHSDAVLRIARRLGLPWSLLAVALIVPRGLRDVVYRWIARNRYRWFGRREACLMPTAALRARFLDADDPPPS